MNLETRRKGPMHPPLSNNGSFVRRQLPYLVVLALAISGVAYTNISHQPLIGYWEFLTLAMGIVCVVTEWGKADDKQGRVQLILTQALHWGAILVTMNIMLFSGVQQLLPSPATRSEEHTSELQSLRHLV